MLRLLQAGDAAMQEAAKHTSAIAHFSMPDVVIEALIKDLPDSGHWAELPRPRQRKQYGYPQTSGRVYEQATSANGPYSPIHSPTKRICSTMRASWQ